MQVSVLGQRTEAEVMAYINPEICIYSIKNNINKHIYIGSTNHYRRRYHQHVDALKQGNHYIQSLQKDWNEYSEGAFTFEIIETLECTNDLIEREIYWTNEISKGDLTLLYNRDVGNKHSKESREKIRLSKLGKKRLPFSPEWKEKLKRYLVNRKGMTNSPETRRLISLHHTRPLLGTHRTEEEKRRISEGQRVNIPIIQYTIDGKLIREFESAYIIQNLLGFDRGFIYKVCQGKRPSAYNFKWKYKE